MNRSLFLLNDSGNRENCNCLIFNGNIYHIIKLIYKNNDIIVEKAFHFFTDPFFLCMFAVLNKKFFN